MKIAISAESTIDLTKELLEKYNIKTVAFTIFMGETVYSDGEVDNETLYNFVKTTNTLPKTSAVNKYQYEEHFKNLLKDYDKVIHFSLSSEMSSAYQNAQSVAEELKNVYVVDTRTLSTGIALLAIKASKLVNEGKEFEEIIEEINKTTNKVQASFVVDKLNFLAKGGRCSSLLAYGANLLSIKPQIVVKDGKMQVGKKYMGKLNSALIKYYNDTLAANPNVDTSVAFITSSSKMEEEARIARENLQAAGFKEIYETYAGGTIATHCGPNTLGILFITK